MLDVERNQGGEFFMAHYAIFSQYFQLICYGKMP